MELKIVAEKDIIIIKVKTTDKTIRNKIEDLM